MLQIYLTRHGQDEDNAKDILNGRRNMPLTALGTAQAKDLASHIKRSAIHFDAIYSSPLQRALSTAQTIAESTKSPSPEILEILIERDFGIMEGLPKDKIEEMCAPDIIKSNQITYFLNPDGAETFPQLVTRGKAIIAEIQNRHQDGNILLVTHGDIGKMIYAAYYGLDWRKVLMQFHFGNSDLLLLSIASPAQEAHVFKTDQHNT